MKVLPGPKYTTVPNITRDLGFPGARQNQWRVSPGATLSQDQVPGKPALQDSAIILLASLGSHWHVACAVVVSRVPGLTTFCTHGALSMRCFRRCMPLLRLRDVFAQIAHRQELDSPLPGVLALLACCLCGGLARSHLRPPLENQRKLQNQLQIEGPPPGGTPPFASTGAAAQKPRKVPAGDTRCSEKKGRKTKNLNSPKAKW
jgi:hypothetical protein